MTAAEKQTFVNALSALRPSSASTTVVARYATNHDQLFFTSIHQNSPFNSNNDFLSWHRWFILYFEKELRNTSVTGAGKITLPYWDWTSRFYTTFPGDRDITSPLWASDFLGPFDTNWNLSRNLGGSTMATQLQLEQVLSNTSFPTFQSQNEGILHNSPHNWVGGEMVSGTSPRDPAFYLHHNMVDKIWQDWQNIGRTTSFADVNMPNTPLPSGVPAFPQAVPIPVPLGVNPATIIDSRAASVKVWYAENGKVILDRYTVTNTENYYYTGVIESGSRVNATVVINGNTENYLTGDFIVPSGTTCNFTSGGLQMGTAPEAGYIKLVPGFRVDAGAIFSAKINSAYFTDASAPGLIGSFQEEKPEESSRKKIVNVFPNPARETLFIEMLEQGGEDIVGYSITNAFGLIIATGDTDNRITEIDISGVTTGIYVLTITTVSGKTHTQRIMVD
jgi:tyrosinase